ncbi:MAG: PspC domain-containing protein [Chitinophagaceae bacterium]|nr:PspC domain-containing protein [Chitinophagaceae bacterium]
MKKVININFQGRVIPIEEIAYESLKQYVDSLRKYFANEEGRDEIINDIEGRIAELFSERLKKGVTCITESDVDAVISSMGRPEDFEAQDQEEFSAGSQEQSQREYTTPPPFQTASSSRGKFYRNADDKILGGVCSGLANYLRVDPIIMRILFVVLSGALFWVYILLWIIVPSRSIQSNITKRLYRSREHKVLGGVCGGLAAYFNLEVWVPRLIFALPFLLALVSGRFNIFWWNWDFGFFPRVISGSFGWGLFVTYVILWIAVPQANTAADRLEMRGEKIDLNSIRDTVKEDLENFKTKAEKWGSEVKSSAQQLGQEAKLFSQQASRQARSFSDEATPIVRRAGSGLGHVIGVLFKAFFLFIGAMIAITLFGMFIALLFGGFALAPFKDFVLEGFWQNLFFWLGLFLFFGIPLVALITWIIRRIMGVRSRNHYLGYTFGGLWVIGLFSVIMLIVMVGGSFKNKSRLDESLIFVAQPEAQRLTVAVQQKDWKSNRSDIFGFDSESPWPINMDEDSFMLHTVRVSLVKSPDSAFHIYRIKSSRGNSVAKANAQAEKITYELALQDSVLTLPRGFAVDRKDKFRNQCVRVVIEAPVGKKIYFDKSLSHFNWFGMKYNGNGNWVAESWEDRDDFFSPQPGREYIISPEGSILRTDRIKEGEPEASEGENRDRRGGDLKPIKKQGRRSI